MSICQVNGPRLRFASPLRRRVACFSSLLTKASTQLCDLKITLAHQVLLTDIQVLLHLPELLLKLRLLTATALLISSLIATGMSPQPLPEHLLRPPRYARRALCVAFYKCPFRLGAEFATCMNAPQQSPPRGRHVTLRPEDCAGTPMVAQEHPVVAVFARSS